MSLGRLVFEHPEKFTNRKNIWPMSVCAYYVGCHGSMYFANTLTLSPTSPCFLRVCSTSLRFENTKGKGEIARNEQFLLFP